MNNPNLIPATVLTGFLGAGKTTLLNRILAGRHGKKIAVIENEVGEVGVDNHLVIRAGEEIFEMNNGCVCCSVRGDFIRILARLAAREERLDAVIIETTGLANPGPVALTFFTDNDVRARYRLDAIVTLVDARHIAAHWDTSDEARKQIAFADTILLNKTDLVPAAVAPGEPLNPGPESRLLGFPSFPVSFPVTITVPGHYALFTQHHPGEFNAGLFATAAAHAGIFAGTSLAKPGLDGAPASAQTCSPVEIKPVREQAFKAAHTHDNAVTSVGIALEGELDGPRLNAWLAELLKAKGADIYRSKGVLAVRGSSSRIVFQGVHMLLDARPGAPWKDGEPRVSEFVFIGRNLGREELAGGFGRCLVA